MLSSGLSVICGRLPAASFRQAQPRRELAGQDAEDDEDGCDQQQSIYGEHERYLPRFVRRFRKSRITYSPSVIVVVK